MAAEEPPGGSGLRQRRGWWIAAGLLALLLAALVVLAVLSRVPWWLVGGAGGVALVALWMTGRLYQGLRQKTWVVAAAAGATGIALLIVIVWPLPILLTSHPARGVSSADRLKAINDARTPLVTALGVLGGAVISSTYLKRRSQLSFSEQITDRYTRAIEQLASTDTGVRIGGIYALERIAVDSPRDQYTVVEVLSAYIRERTRTDESPERRSGATSD